MTLIKLLNIPASALDQILEPFQVKNKILAKLNEKEKLNKDKIELPNYPLSMQEKKYLLNRHFNPDELIEKYGIQGGGWVGEWKNRIIIPIYLGGKLISWTSRTIIKDREPRYKFLSNEESVINPKLCFFNIDNCTNNYVFLVEGLFDVMRLGQDTICGFGIVLVRAQIMYLSERFKKIFILFDNERQAQKKAKEIGLLLQGHGLDAYICDVFGGYGAKDAGDLSPYNARKVKSEILEKCL
jgi:DNA primase